MSYILLSTTQSPGKNSNSFISTVRTSVDGIFSCLLPSCHMTVNNFEVEMTSMQTRSPATNFKGAWYCFICGLVCLLFLAVCPRFALASLL